MAFCESSWQPDAYNAGNYGLFQVWEGWAGAAAKCPHCGAETVTRLENGADGCHTCFKMWEPEEQPAAVMNYAVCTCEDRYTYVVPDPHCPIHGTPVETTTTTTAAAMQTSEQPMKERIEAVYNALPWWRKLLVMFDPFDYYMRTELALRRKDAKEHGYD